MAYDEALAQRIRTALLTVPQVDERKMFGGITFMVSNQMCCGVLKDELIVKVGPEGFDQLIAEPHVRVFDFTGRPMVGMVYVAAPAVASDEALHAWIERGVEFVRTHPKAEKRRRG
jgi:TfoX/Sxy family transcriptional regulator of competence genes